MPPSAGSSTPIEPPADAAVQRPASALASAAVHAILLLAILGLPPAAHLAPYRFPGTSQGVRLLTYYAPGSPTHAASALAVKPAAKPRPTVTARIAAPSTTPKPAPAVAGTDRGTGSADQSGLGEGNISIALLKHFPRPAPDLSTLPPGTAGDIVLNAVIDEHGAVSDLQLVHGLGPAVDNAVMAVVRQWTYTPATRNGAPVPSEQELHFHYERS